MVTKLIPTVKAKGTVEIEVELTYSELARCIMSIVLECTKTDDDAGLDWRTSWNADNFGAYIDGPKWKVSEDENVMILIDAANVLHYNVSLNIE